jgi:DNA replication initiation complex subunit (GINS family)
LQEGLVEVLKRYVDAEDSADGLLPLPDDVYTKVAAYMRNLRRSMNSDNNDVSSRLIGKQANIIEGLVRRLLKLRLDKAIRMKTTRGLLPEERHLSRVGLDFQQMNERFIQAVANGQQSFLSGAAAEEISRRVVVRFIKPIAQVVGVDLMTYGPFKANDLAAIPAGNAEALIANGEAALVRSRDSSYA